MKSEDQIRHEAKEMAEELYDYFREDDINIIFNGVGMFLANLIMSLPTPEERKKIIGLLFINMINVSELQQENDEEEV